MRYLSALPLMLLPAVAHAQTAIPGALDRALATASPASGQGLSLSLQLLLVMGLLTLLPGLILMMTSFTRILIVLSILRQALGLQQSPPNQVLMKDPSLLTERARGFADYPGGHCEGYPDTHKQLYKRFYASISDPALTPDYPQFADGLRQMNILDAELASHKSRAWVDVPA